MEEARRVIDRLERIDALRHDGAPSLILLGEVRLLLREGEEWLAAERAARRGSRDGGEAGLEHAAGALERCRAAVAARAGDLEEVVAGRVG